MAVRKLVTDGDGQEKEAADLDGVEKPEEVAAQGGANLRP